MDIEPKRSSNTNLPSQKLNFPPLHCTRFHHCIHTRRISRATTRYRRSVHCRHCDMACRFHVVMLGLGRVVDCRREREIHPRERRYWMWMRVKETEV